MISGTVGQAVTFPICRALNNPICRQGLRGVGGVSEHKSRIALHVSKRIVTGARINVWCDAIHGQIKTVAEGSETLGIRIHMVLKHVSKKGEGGAVSAL